MQNAFCLGTALLIPARLMASPVGSISGIVKDSSGALVKASKT
jgi:hypothetical protein